MPDKKQHDWLAEIRQVVKRRPSSGIVYGVPGVGKTSLAAYIPGAVFLIDRGEDGVNRLKENSLVPNVPVFPAATCWDDVLGMLGELATAKHEYKALVVDTIGGLERLCHEHVCQRDYNGDWGRQGFTSYQQGYEVSMADWRNLLVALDRLRDEKQMSIMLLGHAKIVTFKNPEGADFDRYNVDCHHKTWGLTHKWADMVLFYRYKMILSNPAQGKPKAKQVVRQICTEHDAAFDAKNRHKLPPVIDAGYDPQEAFNNLSAALKGTK